MRQEKKINFYAESLSSNTTVEYPTPKSSSKFIPDWYKKIKSYPSKEESGSIKACIPFRDALCAGYIIPLWQNIKISKIETDSSDYCWQVDNEWDHSVGMHTKEQIEGSPYADKNQAVIPLKFDSPWIIETPPGYSCLITQPLNRIEDRFSIPSAIVDTDTYRIPISFPFIITTNEKEFVIKKETPLVQVIPFKREDWVSVCEYDKDKDLESKSQRGKLHSVLRRGYQKFWWVKKNFKS